MEQNQTDTTKGSFKYNKDDVVKTEIKDSETDTKLPKYKCLLCGKYIHIQFKQKHLK